MGKEVLHENHSDTGITRVVRDSNGNVRIDSYFGNVRDTDDHDRVSTNVDTGRFFGHGFNHQDSFDSNEIDE